jgi:hypothetical protein
MLSGRDPTSLDHVGASGLGFPLTRNKGEYWWQLRTLGISSCSVLVSI